MTLDNMWTSLPVLSHSVSRCLLHISVQLKKYSRNTPTMNTSAVYSILWKTSNITLNNNNKLI